MQRISNNRISNKKPKSSNIKRTNIRKNMGTRKLKRIKAIRGLGYKLEARN